MPYQYLEDIAVSDVAFSAHGKNLEELFVASADATMSTMVEDLDSISGRESRQLLVQDPDVDMLLFKLLQEIIFFKDAEQLLLRVPEVHILKESGLYALRAIARGEQIDQHKHELLVDVKAVTLHRFEVREIPGGWEATVILDT